MPEPLSVEQVQELREWFTEYVFRDEAAVALCDDWLRAREVVEAAKLPLNAENVEALDAALARYDAGGEGA